MLQKVNQKFEIIYSIISNILLLLKYDKNLKKIIFTKLIKY